MRHGTKLVIALVALLCLPGLVLAQDLPKKQRAEIQRFAYNNSLFVLYHELAHLLFDQFELPVLGREEDAADNVATWILLNRRDPKADQTLVDAAEGWLLSGIAYDSGGSESDYAAIHSLDKQRAYQIVCLMVGMDATAFRRVANQYRIARSRQETCGGDYDLVDRSLQKLLENRNQHGRGSKVRVTYHPAGPRLKNAAKAFRASGVFDEVAAELRDHYQLSTEVQFNARRCGEANAFYDPDTVEIIFCYELMQDYVDLRADSLASTDRQ
jgi:hypothetical protein